MSEHTAGVPEYAYTDFRPGQRVMTVDGYPGRVVWIDEGPYSNRIQVVLDNGMGGGVYDDTMLTPLNEKSSAVDHDASSDYPELGTILSDRPDHAPVLTEEDFLSAKRRTAAAHTADYYLDTPESIALSEQAADLLGASNRAMYRVESERTSPPDGSAVVVSSNGEVLSSQPTRVIGDWHLFLPPNTDAQPSAVMSKQPGYADGWVQGRAGGTREPKQPGNAEYMKGYSLGWAHGVGNGASSGEEWQLTDPSSLVDDSADPDHVDRHHGVLFAESGLWDFIRGSDKPSKTWEGPGHNWSFDWCRFRHNSRCMYAKELNKAASEQAGYAVWIPEDRGYCPRVKWEDQQKCPVGEPGPNVPGGFTDATVPWEQGGQRGGIPDRSSALENQSADTFAFHFTAAWKDVRAKAKRIRADGDVRVVSAHGEELVAEVKGDNHVYQTRITNVPGRYAVGSWECGCAWAAYSWGRTGPWKKYEGRMCSHALALVYEAQARGMYGKTITEDKVAPAWLPKGTDVKVPGDWDRDKGGYTAAVEDRFDWVTLMVATGAPIVQIHRKVMGAMFEAGQVVASHGPLRGRANGRVLDLIFDGGRVFDPNGTEVVGPIWYPTFDPEAGLDFTPTKEGSMGAEHWAMTLLVEAATDSEMQAAARAMLALSHEAEPAVTAELTRLSRSNSAHFEGLRNKFKSESSLLRKMNSEVHEFDGDAGRCAANMSDTLRYTLIANPKNYVKTTKDILNALTRDGYGLRVKNYWERGDPYQGINVAVMTPTGHPFELQFHTPESWRAKTNIHSLYERFRTSDLERERKRLYDKMTEKANKIDVPGGVELIQHLKRQPYMPLVAAAAGRYRYLQLHTVLSGHPTTILREYIGPDDVRYEVWKDGAWVMDNEYADHVWEGQGTRTHEISEEQAQDAIRALGSQASLLTNALFMTGSAGTPPPPVGQQVTKPSGPLAGAFALSLADLHDEPEPALPTTDGADDDDEVDKMEAARTALLASLKTKPPKDPHAWLLEGAKSDDVAGYAKDFLAKQGLKDFSAVERKTIIDEGEGEEAGNLDGLDITGTHYVALEQAAQQGSDLMRDTIGW